MLGGISTLKSTRGSCRFTVRCLLHPHCPPLCLPTQMFCCVSEGRAQILLSFSGKCIYFAGGRNPPQLRGLQPLQERQWELKRLLVIPEVSDAH